jgi:hypothetical protein
VQRMLVVLTKFLYISINLILLPVMRNFRKIFPPKPETSDHSYDNVYEVVKNPVVLFRGDGNIHSKAQHH